MCKDHNAHVWLHMESHILQFDRWVTLLKTPDIWHFFISTAQLCSPTFTRSTPTSTKQAAYVTIQHCLLKMHMVVQREPMSFGSNY